MNKITWRKAEVLSIKRKFYPIERRLYPLEKSLLTGFKRELKEKAALIWYEKEANCLVCGNKSQFDVCPDCRENYFCFDQKRCQGCGKFIAAKKEYCLTCREGRGPKGLSKVTSLGRYEGAWKEFIHAIKYKGQPFLLPALSETLVSWVVDQLPVPDGIVPVPLHQNRLRQRGFNQAEILASILGRSLGIRQKDVLLRTKDTISQIRFGRQERIKNLQNAFAFKPGVTVKGDILWLVDDVVTTGSTLEGCAAVLLSGGAKEIFAFCLGAAEEF